MFSLVLTHSRITSSSMVLSSCRAFPKLIVQVFSMSNRRSLLIRHLVASVGFFMTFQMNLSMFLGSLFSYHHYRMSISTLILCLLSFLPSILPFIYSSLNAMKYNAKFLNSFVKAYCSQS